MKNRLILGGIILVILGASFSISNSEPPVNFGGFSYQQRAEEIKRLGQLKEKVNQETDYADIDFERRERERADIIRRVNNLFGGSDHLVTVTGIDHKEIYFEFDVRTDDIELARSRAVDALYTVLDNFTDYNVTLVNVITKNGKNPLGLVLYEEGYGVSYLGGLK